MEESSEKHLFSKKSFGIAKMSKKPSTETTISGSSAGTGPRVLQRWPHEIARAPMLNSQQENADTVVQYPQRGRYHQHQTTIRVRTATVHDGTAGMATSTTVHHGTTIIPPTTVPDMEEVLSPSETAMSSSIVLDAKPLIEIPISPARSPASQSPTRKKSSILQYPDDLHRSVSTVTVPPWTPYNLSRKSTASSGGSILTVY